MCKILTINVCLAGIIYANTEDPSDNREISKIFSASNILGDDDKTYYHGFVIIMRIDLRKILEIVGNDDAEDPYKLRVYTQNTLLLTYQGRDYNFDNHRDEIEHLCQEDCLMDALDNELHLFAESDRLSEERKWKNLLIVFPNYVQLNAKFVTNQDLVMDEQSLIATSMRMTYSVQQYQTGVNEDTYLYWKVARMDMAPNKRGKVKKKKKNTLADEFFNLNPRPRAAPDDMEPDDVES